MSEQPVDVAILFALDEEFSHFFPFIKGGARPDDDSQTGRTYFLFDTATQDGAPYRCVAASVGAMGPQGAGQLTATIRHRYGPRTIVVLGVAGSLSSDVYVPDTVAADVVDDYLQNAKAEGEGFGLSLSGEPYRPHVRLNNIIRTLPWRYPSLWEKLSQASIDELEQVIAPLKTTRDLYSKVRSVVRTGEYQVHVGHIASGSLIAASESFSNWLIAQRDRKYLAVEMESAGVTNAVYHGAGDERVLIIRGVSDLSDERKKELDSVGKGAFRRAAMRNAIRLLFGLF